MIKQLIISRFLRLFIKKVCKFYNIKKNFIFKIENSTTPNAYINVESGLIIITKELIKLCNIKELQFCVAHEIGHFANQLIYQKHRIAPDFFLSNEEYTSAESDCDIFAARVCGKDIGLSVLNKILVINKEPSVIKARIRALEDL